MRFDGFVLRQYEVGWTIEVKASRPPNAPRHKYTKADNKRRLAEVKVNYTDKLYEQIFPTLDDAVKKIKELCYEEVERPQQ